MAYRLLTSANQIEKYFFHAIKHGQLNPSKVRGNYYQFL